MNDLKQDLKESDKQLPKINRMEKIWYLIALVVSILVTFSSIIGIPEAISTGDSEKILVSLIVPTLFIYGIVYFIKKLKEKSK